MLTVDGSVAEPRSIRSTKCALMEYGVSQQLAELFRENASGTIDSEIARRALPAPNDQ